MKFYIGLGNPDPEHQKTRHNVGFMVINALQKKWQLADLKLQKKFQAEVTKSSEIILAKPQTYMNNSGQAVRSLLSFYSVKPADLTDGGPHQLFVIHDDLDIELGNYKIQFGKGPKVHNGILSIEQQLSTSSFWHVRVGIDGRSGVRSIPGKNYVLQPFDQQELPLITTVIEKIAQRLSSET